MYLYIIFYLILIHFWNNVLQAYIPVVPSKTIPDSRPMGKVYVPIFLPKRPKNHNPLGQHIPIWLMALLSTDFLTYWPPKKTCPDIAFIPPLLKCVQSEDYGYHESILIIMNTYLYTYPKILTFEILPCTDYAEGYFLLQVNHIPL